MIEQAPDGHSSKEGIKVTIKDTHLNMIIIIFRIK